MNLPLDVVVSGPPLPFASLEMRPSMLRDLLPQPKQRGRGGRTKAREGDSGPKLLQELAQLPEELRLDALIEQGGPYAKLYALQFSCKNDTITVTP